MGCPLPGRFTGGIVSLVVIVLSWAELWHLWHVCPGDRSDILEFLGQDQGQAHQSWHIVFPLRRVPTIKGENLGLISIHSGAWQTLLISCLLTIWLIFGTRKANLKKNNSWEPGSLLLPGLGSSPAAQRKAIYVAKCLWKYYQSFKGKGLLINDMLPFSHWACIPPVYW